MAKRRATAPLSTNRPSPLKRPPPAAFRNFLLAALPRADRDRLAPLLPIVPLELKTLLHRPGEPVAHVYFPGGGFCSIVTVLQDGSMVEIATVGREGAADATATLAGVAVASATMVQGETDTCYRMTADDFRREMARRGPFYDLLTRYAQAFVGVVMQSTACNAAHSVEQRLARWLLMAQDRMEADQFPLTQEFAAMMLGATRPTVSVVAATLQQAGLITYHRGQVTVLDRQRLEATACECYGVSVRLLDAVAPPALAPATRR